MTPLSPKVIVEINSLLGIEVLGYHRDEATEVLKAVRLCTGKTAWGWQHPGSCCVPWDAAYPGMWRYSSQQELSCGKELH